MTPISCPRGSSSPATATDAPESTSSVTMERRRSARSARIPPKGDSRMVGSSAAASRDAKIDADPVLSSTYMDRANFNV